MASLNTVDVYQFRVNATTLGQNIVNRVWWRAIAHPTNGLSGTTLQLLTGMVEEFRTNFLLNMSSYYNIWRYELRTYTNTGPSSNVGSTAVVAKCNEVLFVDGGSSSDSGQLTTIGTHDPLPTFNCVVRSGYTNLAGRGQSTKLFLGPIVRNDLDSGGILTPTAQTRWAVQGAFFNGYDMADQGENGTLQAVLLRLKAATTALPQPVLLRDYVTTIEKYGTNAKPRSLRRRKDFLRGGH